VVFALLHILNYLFVRHRGCLIMDLVRLVVNGLILLLVYLAAQNLLVAVGYTPCGTRQPPCLSRPKGLPDI